MPLTIWTTTYTPFRLGAANYRTIATTVDIEPDCIYETGGYQFAVIKNPYAQKYHVAEMTSGVLVGAGRDSFAAMVGVQNDVVTGNQAVMAQQIAVARAKATRAEMVTPEQFFKALTKNP